MYGPVDYKTFLSVLVGNEWHDMAVLVCGCVDVHADGPSNPSIIAIYIEGTLTEISQARCRAEELSTVRQELLQEFTKDCNGDYEGYLADGANAFWESAHEAYEN